MRIILACILLGCSLIANANDDQAMNVNTNETSFVVRLAANPTTGYQWSVVSYDKELLTLKGSQYQKPQSKLIGAGGTMLFTFGLNKGKTYPQKTNMVFKYSRSWEAKGGSIKNVVVTFK